MCVLNEKKVDAHKRREAFRCFIKLMISYTSGKNGATVYIEIARHLNIIRIDFIDQLDCCRSKTFRAFGWKRKWRFKHMKLINSISFRFVWNSLCIRKWDRTNSNGSKWKILNEISRLHSKHICKYFEMYVFLSNVTHFPFYDHRCWECLCISSSVLHGNIIQNKERITFSSTARIRHSSIKFCLVSPAHFHSATAQIHTEQPTAFRVHWQSVRYATTTTTSG